MKKKSLAWAVRSHSSFAGGNINDPTFDQVMDRISEAAKKGGVVTLTISQDNDEHTRRLQVLSEGGFFLILLGQDEPDDYRVAPIAASSETYSGPSKTIEILGDLWNEMDTCRDLDFVIKTFSEFYRAD